MPAHKTALAEALETAGYLTPADRLRRAAIIAVHASPGWDGRKDALYAHVRHDAELLWELFAAYRAPAVHALLTRAAAEIHESERPPETEDEPSAPGLALRESHPATARRANDNPSSDGGGLTRPDGHKLRAPPVRSTAGMEAVSAVARLSLLDTFKVNGQAIGDLTPGEALRWAGSRERDARFVRLLAGNLPPDAPIRRWRTGDEAQAAYDAAARELCDAG